MPWEVSGDWRAGCDGARDTVSIAAQGGRRGEGGGMERWAGQWATTAAPPGCRGYSPAAFGRGTPGWSRAGGSPMHCYGQQMWLGVVWCGLCKMWGLVPGRSKNFFFGISCGFAGVWVCASVGVGVGVCLCSYVCGRSGVGVRVCGNGCECGWVFVRKWHRHQQ